MAERVERRFRFGLAPELLRSRGRRDVLEREFAELERRRLACEEAVAGAAQALDACVREQLTQRERMRAALRSGAPNLDWLGRARFLEELRVDEQRKTDELAARRADERLARHKCELARGDLCAAQARVRALERVAEAQRFEHSKALAQQDQRKLDDLAVERWMPRSTNVR
ncbi:MAG: hypothetical protein IT454_15210 [Planctomycetes bacterium]|nr:hypothetical protein [Planctomycetota bacterium]